MATLGFVDSESEWFKSRVGLALGHVPRNASFGAVAMEHAGLLVVPDAAADERFKRNPLVKRAPRVRFYAGAAVLARDGRALGALGVMDQEPRRLEPAQLESLEALCRQAESLLELRLLREGEGALAPEKELSKVAGGVPLESVLDVVLTVEPGGRILDVSPLAERLFGFMRAETIGRHCVDILSPESAEAFQRTLERAFSTGVEGPVGPFPARARRADGKEFPAEITLVPIVRGKGPRRAEARIRDITGRARLEEGLRSSLVGKVGVGPLSTSTPYPAESCEAAIRSLWLMPEVDHCALFLMSASRDSLRQIFWYGYPAPDHGLDLPLGRRSIVTQAARTGERYLAHDTRGDPLYLPGAPGIRSELALPLMAGGEVVGVLNLESRKPHVFTPPVLALCESVASGLSATLQGTNITELLLRAKVTLEKAFDAMPELVAVLDDAGRIMRLNQPLARRVQRPLRELIGRDFRELFPFCRDWLSATQGSSPTQELEWSELVDEWNDVIYELKLLNLETPWPVTGNRVVLMRDVTREREMSRRMIAFEKRAAAGDLLSGVAHEVRNPLAAVQAAVEAFEMDLEEGSRSATLIGIIRRQVNRLKSLMEDLLHIGRPFQHMTLERASLRSVAEGALAGWMEATTGEPRQVELLAPSEAEGFSVDVDQARIEQVLLNLLDNAAQHSGSEEPIRLSLDRDEGEVRLRVTDCGSGLSPEAASRLFEPFFTTRSNGTGLGLALTKSIVESHGGRVAAWNNDPPPGCTFEISLPRVAAVRP